MENIVQKKPQMKKPQEKVPCGVCEKPLAKASLKSHMKTFHEIKPVKEDKEDNETKVNTIEVKVQVNKEEENEEKKREEKMIDVDEYDVKQAEAVMKIEESMINEEEETELEMRNLAEELELSEQANIYSQEMKKKEKKALEPEGDFLLTTMTGLKLQEMFDTSAFDNLLDDGKTTDDVISDFLSFSDDEIKVLENNDNDDDEIKKVLENSDNDDVANIIGEVLQETAHRANRKDMKENTDMTRQCPKCDKKFGWLADLTRHIMQEHEPFKKLETADPVPYMLGELMSELGEEMGEMRTQTEKFQKDIMRQINFETQALKQDLIRKLNDMSETKHQQSKDKSHEVNTEENKIKQPTKDTKRTVACYSCDNNGNNEVNLKKHIHCLDCGRFFKLARELKKHIQDIHVEEITRHCDRKECHESENEKDAEIKRLNEVIQVNAVILQNTMDANDTLKEQNKILLDLQKEEENIESKTEANIKSTEELLKCTICDYTTNDNAVIKAHMKTKHTNSDISCPKCMKGFESQKTLRTHMMNVHPTNQNLPVGHPESARQKNLQDNFMCPDCSQKFTSRKKWREHIHRQHMNQGFECAECRIKFQTKQEYDEHINEQHDQFITNAPICRFFKQGRCTRQHCTFKHPQSYQQRQQVNQAFQPAPRQFHQNQQQQYQYQPQPQHQPHQRGWLEACRRGPACSFLAQGRCYYFHNEQEQPQAQKPQRRACKWQEDCKRVPHCPFRHSAEDFPPLKENQNQS